MVAGSWTVLLLEYILAFGLLKRSFHKWLIPMGTGMHLAFYWIFPVYTFSLTCILMYLAVVDPNKVHQFTEG